VLRDGLVLGERYAPGYGPETRLHGWSLTKSITNALLGRLVMQRRLDMRAPAGILEWRNDARAAITPEHLLRMTSGLGFGQSLEAGIADLWNPASQMQFAGHDMAAMAAAAPLVAAPGTRFVYQNGNTQLLSRLVRDLAGGDEAAVLRYAQAELFGPLGMAGAVLETDATGTPVGGSHAWAGARDWARFGVLFAQDGVVGGQRLLPEGWLAWSAAPTPGAEFIGYGAGFWTQRGEGGAAYRREQGLPEEALMARGAFGQYVIAVPSRRLVVVRLGFSYDPRARVESVARLVAEAMAALE
jgi:CubicO group peptidase (beta-lactamase class C family)